MFAYKTENRLESVDIKEEDIYLIIKNLIPNKADGWDGISIRMIEHCGRSKCNVNFESQLGKVQFNASLAIAGVTQGTNRDSIYAELGLESLSARKWYQKLLFFYKIVHGLSAAYLTAYINFVSERSHNTRSSTHRHLEEPICRTKVFQSSFFLLH